MVLKLKGGNCPKCKDLGLKLDCMVLVCVTLLFNVTIRTEAFSISSPPIPQTHPSIFVCELNLTLVAAWDNFFDIFSQQQIKFDCILYINI